MALYAVDDDDLIDACSAEKGKVYGCLECFGPVKVRRGSNRLFHFYHLKAAPTCRLYSKSEDHLRAQVELQKSFPPGVLQVERSFIEVNRVADLCWEKEKIIFEVQCSLMSEEEAAARIRDYRSMGYEVAWLLDDKMYNKRILRPAEFFLRQHCCYFLSLPRGGSASYYDQFETIAAGLRIKKGRKVQVDLQRIRVTPEKEFGENLPLQVLRLLAHCPRYFRRDRIDRALHPKGAFLMDYWRLLEIETEKKWRKPHPIKERFFRYFLWPYLERIKSVLRRG